MPKVARKRRRGGVIDECNTDIPIRKRPANLPWPGAGQYGIPEMDEIPREKGWPGSRKRKGAGWEDMMAEAIARDKQNEADKASAAKIRDAAAADSKKRTGGTMRRKRCKTCGSLPKKNRRGDGLLDDLKDKLTSSLPDKYKKELSKIDIKKVAKTALAGSNPLNFAYENVKNLF